MTINGLQFMKWILNIAGLSKVLLNRITIELNVMNKISTQKKHIMNFICDLQPHLEFSMH